MRKFTIFLTLILFIGLQVLQAQTKEISGKVTGDDGKTIPGVSVVVKGTTIGITTDLNGEYVLTVPEDAKIIVFSFVGMKTHEIEIGTSKIINAQMEPDIFRLDEVIVSGVASGTQRKKLTVSVSKVGSEALEEVPAINAATAIQGKMAGVRVTNNTGQPGNQATILIRGATSLMGSQNPLYIVDGAIIEGNLADINVDDIESIEVVKGAAAAALYGSRAGNGVVVIKTKRGETLAKGETRIVIRNEIGMNQIPKESYLDLAEHHNYKLEDPNHAGNHAIAPGTIDPNGVAENSYTDYFGVSYPVGYNGGSRYDGSIVGNRIVDDDHYADNEYAYIKDHQDRMFRNGLFYTNYISVGHNSNKTNLQVSFENSAEEGVIEMTDGYDRQNFRINADHLISKKLKLSASQLVGKSSSNTPGGAFYETGGIFFDVLFLLPDCDLDRVNEEQWGGEKYDFDPSFWNTNEENPLYSLSKIQREELRNYAIGTYSGQWYATDWLIVDAKYTFDRRNTHYTSWTPKGMLDRGGGSLVEDLGQIRFYDQDMFFYTGQATLHLQKKFGDLSTKAKLSYLYEDNHISNSDVIGYDFSVKDIPSLDAIVGNKSSSSEIQDIISNNIFGIFQFDYKGKYLADLMVRYDGSSLFGENERWHPYFRISGAYRITEDFTIPGIQELKVRAAYGTSGQRPGFWAQYETYTFSGGLPSPNTLGNKDLKPSLSKEFEVGINVDFLKKFSFEYVFAKTNTEDQIMLAPLPAYFGYPYQWQNAGALESRASEASFAARIIDNDNFKWTSRIIYDRIRQEVTKLDIPPFQTGPVGQDANQAFFIREGEIFGMIYGSYFLRSLDELEAQLGPGDSRDNYEVNSDGYVVPAGSQGTINEVPIKMLDADGNPIKQQIGNTNPDFRLGFANNFSYKNLSLYFLVDWSYGGDVYNRTAQWLYRDLRHADVDQFDKAPNEKKVTDYYSALYDVNDVNSHFVEDATYVKVRELAIYYTLGRDKLSNFANGIIKGIKIGFVARNLFTFTNYSGYDPEVGQSNWDPDMGAVNDPTATRKYYGNNQFYRFDAYGYPNYRTFSGSLTLTF